MSRRHEKNQATAEFASKIRIDYPEILRLTAVLKFLQWGKIIMRNPRILLAVLGLSIASASTFAQDSSPTLVSRNRVRLKLAGAEAVVEATKRKAESLGLKGNIAVVDDGGHLLAFARMDGARPASASTALTKAVTAATFQVKTGPLGHQDEPDVLLNLSIQNASGGKITTLKGGLPIVIEGQVVGGVGVGGGTGDQDAEAAAAGVQALLDLLEGD